MKFIGRLFSILLMVMGLGFIVIYFWSSIQSMVDTVWTEILWILFAGIASLGIGVVLTIILFRKKTNNTLKKGNKTVSLDQLALEQLERDFKAGNKEAIIENGKDYGLFKNRPDLAFKHYEKAAELGSTEAKGLLGACYMYGTGTQKDEKQGFKLWKEVADKGDSLAINDVADCYMKGRGITRNITSAEKYYKLAVDKGNTFAMVSLAQIYKDRAKKSENGSDNWFKKAFKLFEKAALKDNGTALYEMGVCYRCGYGVTKSELKAMDYFEKASKHGDYQSSIYCAIDAKKYYKETKKLYYLELAYEYYNLALRQGAPYAITSSRNEVKAELDALKPKPKPVPKPTPKPVNKQSSNSGYKKPQTNTNRSSTPAPQPAAPSGPAKERYFYFKPSESHIYQKQEFLRMEYVASIPKYKHVDIHVEIVFVYRNCDGRSCTITKYTTVHDVFDTEEYTDYDCKKDFGKYMSNFLAKQDFTWANGEGMVEKWL